MNLPGRGWWQRLRHGRGFGVHSPSAYRYIREVLRERYAYYAYEQADAAASHMHGGRARARMLMRIAIHARASEIAVAGCADAVRGIVAAACPNARIHSSITPDCRLLVLGGDAFGPDAAMACAQAGATIVLLNRRRADSARLLPRLQAEMRTGHLFLNGDGVAVFVPCAAPAQTFSVRF